MLKPTKNGFQQFNNKKCKIMAKKAWVYSPEKVKKEKLSDVQKKEISEKCQPLVEEFKKQYINPNPNKEFNYCVDIYTKWYQNYFYFCQKYKSESVNRIKDEFEVKFVRLTYIKQDCYQFSYLRHTEQWFLVAEDLTLQKCLEMMIENPNFLPIG